jgi:hypothetical protein
LVSLYLKGGGMYKGKDPERQACVDVIEATMVSIMVVRPFLCYRLAGFLTSGI